MTKVSETIHFKPSWLSTESYSLMLLLVSAMLYSMMAAFVKLASNDGLPATELLFVRVIFQSIFILVGMFNLRPTTVEQGKSVGDVQATPVQQESYIAAEIRNESAPATTTASTTEQQHQKQRPLIFTPFGGTWEVQKIVLLRGMFGGLGIVLHFFAISTLPLGDAITILSLYPVITIFAAAIYLHEPIRLFHVLAAGTSIIGAICVAHPTFTATSGWIGYAAAILGCLCQGAVVTLIRKAGTIGAHTFQLMWSWACFGIFFSVMLGLQPWLQDINGSWRIPSIRNEPHIWWYILGIGMMGSCGHFLINYAGRLAPAGLSGIVWSTDIGWAYVWEIVVFHQIPAKTTRVGVMLVLSSLCMIAGRRLWEERSQQKTKRFNLEERAYSTMSDPETVSDENTSLLET